jgi:hypothetical protein
MLYYLLLLVSFDKSGGTAFGTVSGAEEELYLSCVGKVKMAYFHAIARAISGRPSGFGP